MGVHEGEKAGDGDLRPQLLQVLLLEDSRFDAELIRECLIGHFPGANMQVVCREEDFVTALQDSVDVVLSDHALPGFCGTDALELARVRAPGVPFIFVSDFIGEDNVAELLKRGATDYVSKQRLQRLPMAVERALREVETSRSRDSARQQLLKAEASLHEQQELLVAVLASTESLIFAKDLDGRYILANDSMARLLQRRPRDIIGLTDADVFDAATAATLRSNDLQVQLGGRALRFEEAMSRAGEQRCYLVTKTPLRIGQRVAGVAGTAVDITEHKRIETHVAELNATLKQQVHERTAQLLELAEREHAILASAASAIVATDLAAIITSFNPAAEGMLRLREVQALGTSALAFFDRAELVEHALELPQDVRDNAQQLSPQLQQALSRAATQPGKVRTEWTIVRADGTRFPGLLTFSVLRDGRGQAIGFLGVLTDLSERQALDEALRQRTLQAEVASQAKSVFLAHMSHELRTPLNAVIGLSQLLLQRTLPEGVGRFVGHIHDAGEQLLGLVTDVLDLSRLESGQMALESVDFDPAELLQSALALVQPQAEAKSLALVADVSPELPARLVGDPLRLRQVLLNLLSNAVKFTAQGSVTLRMAALARDAYTVVLRLEVADTGIGIAPEQQQRIFEPFTQADSYITRRYGGTGLGLSIVQRLVAMMQGTLSVQSQLEQGSTFTVELPLRLA